MTKTTNTQFTEQRDILIALQVNFQNLEKTMSTGMADMRADMLEIKTGFNTTLTDHEGRLRRMERLDDERNLTVALTQVRENSRWIADYNAGRRTIIAISSAIGGLVGLVLSIVATWLHVSGR